MTGRHLYGCEGAGLQPQLQRISLCGKADGTCGGQGKKKLPRKHDRRYSKRPLNWSNKKSLRTLGDKSPIELLCEKPAKA